MSALSLHLLQQRTQPVPRLVPLPGSHTLTVLRPELRTAESYGQLRPDNLQLVLKAEVCVAVSMWVFVRAAGSVCWLVEV